MRPATQTSAVGGPAKSETAALPGLAGLMARAQQQQDNLNQLKQQAAQLKAESAGAKAARRAVLTRQLAILQSQIELTQSRLDSYSALVQFESTTTLSGTQGTGLSSQIDALERSVPQLNASAKAAARAAQGALPATAATPLNPADAAASAPDNGLLGAIEALIRLGEEHSALGDRINETRRLSALSITAARAPLIARLRELNTRADALAAAAGRRRPGRQPRTQAAVRRSDQAP